MTTLQLAKVSLLFAVIFGLVAIGIYILRRYRVRSDKDVLTASELLTKFRELHARGELNDAEFRTIKTKLATQLQEELNDTNGTG